MFICLFSSLILFCQNKKTIQYIDYNGKEVTEEQFNSYDKTKVFERIIENDSILIKKIFLVKVIASLDSIQLQKLNNFLTETLENRFDKNKNTLIHLYNQNNNKIYKDLKNKKYWKYIKSISGEFQSFMIGTKNSQINEDKNLGIYIDKNDLLYDSFFKDFGFQINHLLIKPNGDIYIYYGVEDIIYVLDHSI